MNPTISIIIATYNSANTLQRALESVLNQSLQDWECVIVDGASKDGYDAYNKGWRMAKGEWIHYLGSDDELTVDGIDLLIANSDGADIVYGNTLFRKLDVSELRLQISSKPKMGGFCCHQSLIMKRELISKLNGFDMQYKILADKDLICRAMKTKCKIRQTNTTVSIFSIGGTSSPSIKRYKESFIINKRYRPLSVSLFELVESVVKNIILYIIRKVKK